MTELDQRLAALWAADDPPAADPAFVIAVMERAERRRLALDIASLVAPTVGGAAVLWAAAPWLSRAWTLAAPMIASPAFAAGVAGLAMAGWLWAWVSGRLQILPTDA
jgi:hypothetical protein